MAEGERTAAFLFLTAKNTKHAKVLTEGKTKVWPRSRSQIATLKRGISVRSNINRAESHPFYRKLGYELKKTQQVYRKRL